MSNNVLSKFWVAPIAKKLTRLFPIGRASLPFLAEQPTRCSPLAVDNTFSQHYFAGELVLSPSQLAQCLAIAAILFSVGLGVSLVVFACAKPSSSPLPSPANSGDPSNSTVDPPPPLPPSSTEAAPTPKKNDRYLLVLLVVLLALVVYMAAKLIPSHYWRLFQSKHHITITGVLIPNGEDIVTRLLAVGLSPWSARHSERAIETEVEITTPANSPQLSPLADVQPTTIDTLEEATGDEDSVELIDPRSGIRLGEHQIQIREPLIWMSPFLALLRFKTDNEEGYLAFGIVCCNNVMFIFVVCFFFAMSIHQLMRFSSETH